MSLHKSKNVHAIASTDANVPQAICIHNTKYEPLKNKYLTFINCIINLHDILWHANDADSKQAIAYLHVCHVRSMPQILWNLFMIIFLWSQVERW